MRRDGRSAAAAAILAMIATVTTGCESGGSAQPGQATRAASFNQTDADFIVTMNQLLSQATTLAEAAPSRSRNPGVNQLAHDMLASHYPQFETVVGWLDDLNDQPGIEVPHEHNPDAERIPGLPDVATLSALMDSSGAAFDQAFLDLLITHHEAALEVARSEQAGGIFTPGKELAAAIEADLAAHLETARALRTELG